VREYGELKEKTPEEGNPAKGMGAERFFEIWVLLSSGGNQGYLTKELETRQSLRPTPWTQKKSKAGVISKEDGVKRAG